MSKVINLFEHSEELKNISYTNGGSGDFGVGTLDRGIELQRLNDKKFLIITPDGSQVFDRETLAEFLHVASVFIDSEERYKPDVDLIGCDYE